MASKATIRSLTAAAGLIKGLVGVAMVLAADRLAFRAYAWPILVTCWFAALGTDPVRLTFAAFALGHVEVVAVDLVRGLETDLRSQSMRSTGGVEASTWTVWAIVTDWPTASWPTEPIAPRMSSVTVTSWTPRCCPRRVWRR